MNVYASDLLKTTHTGSKLGDPVFRDPRNRGPIICKLRKDQELALTCIAKKVLLKNTLNGPHVLPLDLNMILGIN